MSSGTSCATSRIASVPCESSNAARAVELPPRCGTTPRMGLPSEAQVRELRLLFLDSFITSLGVTSPPGRTREVLELAHRFEAERNLIVAGTGTGVSAKKSRVLDEGVGVGFITAHFTP